MTGSVRSAAQPNEASSLAGAKSYIPGSHETFVQVEHLQKGLCGRSRPHFFRGVATVVIKLFHIVEPDWAFFGAKDYQQLQVIKRLVRDLDMAVQVAAVPIMREPDGLAMSSRNKLLSADARAAALAIPMALQWAEQAVQSGITAVTADLQGEITRRLQHAGGKVDYIQVVDAQELIPIDSVGHVPAVIAIAAIFGNVRLIDNCQV